MPDLIPYPEILTEEFTTDSLEGNPADRLQKPGYRVVSIKRDGEKVRVTFKRIGEKK